MKCGFWGSCTGRPGTVSGALFFQPKKFKTSVVISCLVFGVFMSTCFYMLFYFLDVSLKCNKTNGCLYFVVVQWVCC